jgi:hypothetical protein
MLPGGSFPCVCALLLFSLKPEKKEEKYMENNFYVDDVSR